MLVHYLPAQNQTFGYLKVLEMGPLVFGKFEVNVHDFCAKVTFCKGHILKSLVKVTLTSPCSIPLT